MPTPSSIFFGYFSATTEEWNGLKILKYLLYDPL
jgi:hypothetical protein